MAEIVAPDRNREISPDSSKFKPNSETDCVSKPKCRRSTVDGVTGFAVDLADLVREVSLNVRTKNPGLPLTF